MKRTLLDSPDEFSLLPFLSLLPSERRVSELGQLAATFHARQENVMKLHDALSEEESEQKRSVMAEYTMLTQVVDWITQSEKE